MKITQIQYIYTWKYTCTNINNSKPRTLFTKQKKSICSIVLVRTFFSNASIQFDNFFLQLVVKFFVDVDFLKEAECDMVLLHSKNADVIRDV